ncbi:hypothetical protein EGJ28_16295 [Stutzerimonas xanthomarina]|jgi:hypothetical protein|uniref:Uncharacterized protein n=1 Tax=Stutzerimonas xanthomarina TaxID=271420 RepID=A0A3R8U9Q2_9GAMM|nr:MULTISPECIES: hypothetical protein [Stutzerimonas]MBK3919967.1 hypothetical protein [Stutzerimonas frequens]RRV08825.1 hypothetical protein EGJ28_16295 [Stutzerimonas xanthomarina]
MDGICTTFVLCCQLGTLCGQASIKDLPGCWERQVDADWHISFNGHEGEVRNSSGLSVPPLSILVKHSRYFADGIITPFGGMIVGGREAEADLMAALEGAIRVLGGTPATDAESDRQGARCS